MNFVVSTSRQRRENFGGYSVIKLNQFNRQTLLQTLLPHGRPAAKFAFHSVPIGSSENSAPEPIGQSWLASRLCAQNVWPEQTLNIEDADQLPSEL